MTEEDKVQQQPSETTDRDEDLDVPEGNDEQIFGGAAPLDGYPLPKK